MQSLLGESLVTRTGSKVSTTTALAGCKYIAVYFSAHWCPPCRQFTPLLGEFFQAHASTLKVAVVFASRDRDEKSFKDYFASCALFERVRVCELLQMFFVPLCNVFVAFPSLKTCFCPAVKRGTWPSPTNNMMASLKQSCRRGCSHTICVCCIYSHKLLQGAVCSPFLQAHSIRSIPTLLVFSPNGFLITNEGVQFMQVYMACFLDRALLFLTAVPRLPCVGEVLHSPLCGEQI